MVSPVVETIKLIPFVDEDVSESVLITPNMMKVESPIEPKTTQFKTHDDITTTDATLKRKIESRILTSLYDSVDLNIDFSNYENFVTYGSMRQRVDNFHRKLQTIEGHTLKN